MILLNRPLVFWVVILFMLLILGQTMALVDYEFAVAPGLQENAEKIVEFGVQLNRAYGARDTLIFIPLIVVSIVGLSLKKRWALLICAAVLGASVFWATTAAFAFKFSQGVPSYSFNPGLAYWFVISFYIVFGLGVLVTWCIEANG